MAISEEFLMAYADGELDAEQRAEVEALMAADPQVAERVRRHGGLRERMGQTHRAALTEPPPERLLAALQGPAARTSVATVIDLAARRAARAPKPQRPILNRAHWGGLAACLVVGVIVGAGVVQRTGPGMFGVSATGSISAQGPLVAALNSQTAADPGSGVIKIGVSFRNTDGLYCRTFQVNQGPGTAGVACREPKAWSVRMLAASPLAAPAAQGYRTAASSSLAPVTATVEAMIQGQPLDARGEAAAKAVGWVGK